MVMVYGKFDVRMSVLLTGEALRQQICRDRMVASRMRDFFGLSTSHHAVSYQIIQAKSSVVSS
jgi:hypothetical protein